MNEYGRNKVIIILCVDNAYKFGRTYFHSAAYKYAIHSGQLLSFKCLKKTLKCNLKLQLIIVITGYLLVNSFALSLTLCLCLMQNKSGYW